MRKWQERTSNTECPFPSYPHRSGSDALYRIKSRLESTPFYFRNRIYFRLTKQYKFNIRRDVLSCSKGTEIGMVWQLYIKCSYEYSSESEHTSQISAKFITPSETFATISRAQYLVWFFLSFSPLADSFVSVDCGGIVILTCQSHIR